MIEQYVIGRVAVFIDAANILYSQKSLGWQVDYVKLHRYFLAKCACMYCGFYNGEKTGDNAQQKFFSVLRNEGYCVKTKPIKYIKTTHGFIMKGNLDIEIAFDMITMKDTYDTCVLMSGDSDFEIVVRYLRREGKRVIVLSTKNHVSREIIQSCSKYINLEKLRMYIERKKSPVVVGGRG